MSDLTIIFSGDNVTVTSPEKSVGTYKNFQWVFERQTFTAFSKSLYLSKEVPTIKEGIAFVDRVIGEK